MARSWEPIDSPPSVSQVITERKMSALRRKTFRSSSSLSTPFFLSFFFSLIREEKEREIAMKGGERQEVRPRPFPHGDTDSDVVTPRHYLIQPPPPSLLLSCHVLLPLFSPALHKAICSVDFSDYLCRTRSGSFKPLCLSQPLQMR